MKDVESGISLLKEVRQNVVRGIRERLDALSPEQRLHVVIGMFGILVVLFLYCIWQTMKDIADRTESTNIVIELIPRQRLIKKSDCHCRCASLCLDGMWKSHLVPKARRCHLLSQIHRLT